MDSSGRRALAGVLITLVVTATLVLSLPAASVDPVAGNPAVTYRMPVEGDPAVARRFERPAQAWSAGHRGVDLRTAEGAPVLAPADGVVTFAGSVAGRGVVTVSHRDGRRSSLEPVSPAVAVGAEVRGGQELGTIQAAGSHCAPAACLHWGVRLGADYQDPLRLLPGAGPVVLLSSGTGSGVLRRARRPAAACAGGPSPRCASERSATR